MPVCERHVEIVEVIDEIDDRVRYLELRDTSTSMQLENLISRVDKLVKIIEDWMAGARRVSYGIIVTLIGFVFWYIQSL